MSSLRLGNIFNGTGLEDTGTNADNDQPCGSIKTHEAVPNSS